MTRDDCFRHRDAYLIVGDLDKPFHLPECECGRCEAWRRSRGRATHAELRGSEGPANDTP